MVWGKARVCWQRYGSSGGIFDARHGREEDKNRTFYHVMSPCLGICNKKRVCAALYPFPSHPLAFLPQFSSGKAMPTRTLFARAETPSSSSASAKAAPDTSFFTVSRVTGGMGLARLSFFTQFLVALLILAFASAALILRALILRRRFRNRLQAAIDAGLIPRQAIPEKKPEFYEAYVRGVESGAKTWASVMVASLLSVWVLKADSHAAIDSCRAQVAR